MHDVSAIAPELGISEAFHKAYVSVDEKGTEAAAAIIFIGRVTDPSSR